MAPNVDGLNIVSNAKPLLLENKTVDNDKIEMFATDSIKVNIDEIELSSQNNSNQVEEKSDNKKKWLIGTGIALGTLAIGVAGYLLLKKVQVPKYELSSELSTRLKNKPMGKQIFDDQFNEFFRLRRQKIEHEVSSLINEGDLLHGSYYNTETTRSIFKNGIMSGEIGLKGKHIQLEDGETFGCADFFSSPKKMSIQEYFKDFINRKFGVCQSPEKSYLPFNSRGGISRGQKKIAYVIDMEKLKKNGTMLLKNSCAPSTLSGSNLEDIVSHFPLNYENLQATLVGVPANYISKIIVGDRVNSTEVEMIKKMAKEAGLDLKIYNIIGEQL